ncbi:hypothetical protein G163CM_10240 [Pseudocitrobacter corydidari]|uniref:Uncharacterized protein n=1 Tax=Pseudocitrobacter corydidari TaxID=2891570 RepID=A0ABY3S1C5_9ENTR|nr:hypothetical protein G163CM_10240 [Pseudocitrobacter corydidari]
MMIITRKYGVLVLSIKVIVRMMLMSVIIGMRALLGLKILMM